VGNPRGAGTDTDPGGPKADTQAPEQTPAGTARESVERPEAPDAVGAPRAPRQRAPIGGHRRPRPGARGVWSGCGPPTSSLATGRPSPGGVSISRSSWPAALALRSPPAPGSWVSGPAVYRPCRHSVGATPPRPLRRGQVWG